MTWHCNDVDVSDTEKTPDTYSMDSHRLDARMRKSLHTLITREWLGVHDIVMVEVTIGTARSRYIID